MEKKLLHKNNAGGKVIVGRLTLLFVKRLYVNHGYW